MRIKQRTKELAYIRRMIRNAINWHGVDKGMPNFWTTENYKGSRAVEKKAVMIGNYPYYTKSSRAIEDIAVKIYDKIKGDTIYTYKREVTKKQLIKGVSLRFTTNNKIQYGQDFSQYKGVPDIVTFIIDKVTEDRITVVANGYGIVDNNDNYGNGALHIPFTALEGHYDEVEIYGINI